MGDISQNFSRVEFACKCGCGFDTVDTSTLEVLERVRAHFGAPVVVNSGCRCAEHNRAVGGAPNSQHVLARAADIRIKGVSPDRVYVYAGQELNGTGGLGRYGTFTHIDTRSIGPARWSG
jgi:uncharacterized protein YcbK (DUF882 family)